MKVLDVEWDEDNMTHFEEHGRCHESEVEEVLFSRCHPARTMAEAKVRGESRVNVIGRTCAGRYLLVVVAPKPRGVLRPVTAFPLGIRQIQKYLAWRKTVKR